MKLLKQSITVLLVLLSFSQMIQSTLVSEYDYIKGLIRDTASEITPLKSLDSQAISFDNNHVIIFPKQSSTSPFSEKITIVIDSISTSDGKPLDNLSLRIVDLHNFHYTTFPKISQDQVYTYTQTGEILQFGIIFDTNDILQFINDDKSDNSNLRIAPGGPKANLEEDEENQDDSDDYFAINTKKQRKSSQQQQDGEIFIEIFDGEFVDGEGEFVEIVEIDILEIFEIDGEQEENAPVLDGEYFEYFNFMINKGFVFVDTGKKRVSISFSIQSGIERGGTSWVTSSVIVGAFIFVSLILAILIIIFNKRLHSRDHRLSQQKLLQQQIQMGLDPKEQDPLKKPLAQNDALKDMMVTVNN